MKKLAIVSGLMMALSAPAAMAASENMKKAENIGFGSGLVVGAIAGGPLGAIIGGISGIFVGHSVAADKEIENMETALAQNEDEINQLLASNQQLLGRLRSSEEQQRLQLVSLTERENTAMDTNLTMHVQFRTGSSKLESIYSQQLAELADAMQQNKQLKIELSGFADRRGDEKYNQSLSAERVESVKQLLVSQGVSAARITSLALGEAMPLDTTPSLDGDSFDRRVSLRLSADSLQTVANH